jgi:predicted HicB family RNase H-like nuclease
MNPQRAAADAPTQTMPRRHGTGTGRSVLEVAERLHAMEPEWVVFFREILGIEGVIRRTFSSAAGLQQFECSPEYARIRELLDDLRDRQRVRPPARESQRVVTVRMPRSLHETLKAEAEEMGVSINTLCIPKLLRLLDAGDREDLDGEATVTAEKETEAGL